MTILKTTLPVNSALNISGKKYDYTDSFKGVVRDPKNNFTTTDLGKAFFKSGPKWVGALFTLRNKIVALFGLKTSNINKDRKKVLENFTCEPGDQLGIFKVFEKSENKIILGEDDKHLNFRVSLFKKQYSNEANNKEITISTTVEFNNWFGKLYFLPVRPFHKIIVPTMLKGIIKELEEEV